MAYSVEELDLGRVLDDAVLDEACDDEASEPLIAADSDVRRLQAGIAAVFCCPSNSLFAILRRF